MVPQRVSGVILAALLTPVNSSFNRLPFGTDSIDAVHSIALYEAHQVAPRHVAAVHRHGIVHLWSHIRKAFSHLHLKTQITSEMSTQHPLYPLVLPTIGYLPTWDYRKGQVRRVRRGPKLACKQPSPKTLFISGVVSRWEISHLRDDNAIGR
jgi:hypothetical protein